MTFRVTADEKAELEAKAARAGMTTSGFVGALATTRQVTFIEPTYKPMHPALLAELRRIGNNLNQLAHAANAELPVSAVDAFRVAHELVDTISRNEILCTLADFEVHHGAEDGQQHPAPALPPGGPSVAFATSGRPDLLAEAIEALRGRGRSGT